MKSWDDVAREIEAFRLRMSGRFDLLLEHAEYPGPSAAKTGTNSNRDAVALTRLDRKIDALNKDLDMCNRWGIVLLVFAMCWAGFAWLDFFAEMLQ